jgi:hypothetical protein
MPMRDERGVVHVISWSENPERFGGLECGQTYTADVRLGNVGHLLVKPTRQLPTCVRCIARPYR